MCSRRRLSRRDAAEPLFLCTMGMKCLTWLTVVEPEALPF